MINLKRLDAIVLSPTAVREKDENINDYSNIDFEQSSFDNSVVSK